MKFENVLPLVREGKKISRVSWLGETRFVFLVEGSTFKVNRKPLNTIYSDGTKIEYQSHLDMAYDVNKVKVWVPTSEDLLAEDWAEYPH